MVQVGNQEPPRKQKYEEIKGEDKFMFPEEASE